MVHDPVMADLNRHLAELDEADARAEGIEEVLEEMIKKREIISDVLADELNLPEDLHRIAVEAVITSDWQRFGLWIEDLLRQSLDKAAEQEYDRRVEQAKQDAAEARAMSREAFDE